MVTVFWVERSNICQLPPKRKNSQWRILSQLIRHVQQLFEEKVTAYGQHHHNNATVQFNELGYKSQPHSSYYGYLTYSGYFLYPNLKKWLGEKRFGSNNEIVAQINDY